MMRAEASIIRGPEESAMAVPDDCNIQVDSNNVVPLDRGPQNEGCAIKNTDVPSCAPELVNLDELRRKEKERLRSKRKRENKKAFVEDLKAKRSKLESENSKHWEENDRLEELLKKALLAVDEIEHKSLAPQQQKRQQRQANSEAHFTDEKGLEGLISRQHSLATLPMRQPMSESHFTDEQSLEDIISRQHSAATLPKSQPQSEAHFTDKQSLEGPISRQHSAATLAVRKPKSEARFTDEPSLEGLISSQHSATTPPIRFATGNVATMEGKALHAPLEAPKTDSRIDFGLSEDSLFQPIPTIASAENIPALRMDAYAANIQALLWKAPGRETLHPPQNNSLLFRALELYYTKQALVAQEIQREATLLQLGVSALSRSSLHCSTLDSSTLLGAATARTTLPTSYWSPHAW